jgi:hypothetical protein
LTQFDQTRAFSIFCDAWGFLERSFSAFEAALWRVGLLERGASGKRCVWKEVRRAVLMKLCVLGFSLLQDGDVGVGFFP